MLPNPHLFGYELQWYSFFHWFGVVAAFAFGTWYYQKESNKIPYGKMILLLLSLPFIAMLGSRIAGMFEAYVASGSWPDMSVLFLSPSKGKFRWCGTLLAFLILLPPLARLLKIKYFLIFLDTLAISLCLLTAIVKQGCLFAGDGCYGIPTTLPWGMYFPYGVAPNLLPAHPTPLYDGIFHLLLFAFLIWWNRRKSFEGQTTILYLLAMPVFYILLEVIRLNPRTSLGATVPQIVYFMILVSALVIYSKRGKSLIV